MGRGGIPSSGQLQGGPVLPSPGSAGLSRAWAPRWTDRVWLGPLWPRQTSRVPQRLGAGPAEPGCARGWRRGPSLSARLERVTTMLRAWARPPGSTWRRPLPGGQSRCRPLAGSGRVTVRPMPRRAAARRPPACLRLPCALGRCPEPRNGCSVHFVPFMVVHRGEVSPVSSAGRSWSPALATPLFSLCSVSFQKHNFT